jgi:hypothetical protein
MVNEDMSIILLFIGLIFYSQLGEIIFSTTPIFALGMGGQTDDSNELGKENLTMTSETNMIKSTRNMTFGSALDIAKMHLTEAIMDLEQGNTKGAMMQLNMTQEGIKMHEIEMMQMLTEKNILNRTSEGKNITR